MESNISPESRSVEGWMENLSRFSQAVKDAKDLPDAVSAVEKESFDMLSWAGRGRFNSDKRHLRDRVQSALESICAPPQTIKKDQKMMARLLDVGDRLQQCYKKIRDQQVDQQIGRNSLQG